MTYEDPTAALFAKAERMLGSALADCARVLRGCGASTEELMQATLAFGPVLNFVRAQAKPPAEPAPNQCDGCVAGYPRDGHIHRYPDGELVGCERERYESEIERAYLHPKLRVVK